MNKVNSIFFLATVSVTIFFYILFKSSTVNTLTPDAIASQWLGKPYQFDPMQDHDAPKLNLEAFDCFSLIQSILAVKNSYDDESLSQQLSTIRYKDAIHHFTHRYHFASHEWIPAMIKKGYLSEATHTLNLKSKHISQIAKPLAFWQYQERLHPEFHNMINTISPPQQITQEIDFIPTQILISEPLPSSKPMIIALVNHNWPNQNNPIGTQLLVSHFGLLFQDAKKQWQVIHASSKAKQVIQETWSSFLAQRQNHNHIDGIAFYHIL
ncbi:MAG: N-acetylmuramoyl-L-alanine amidase-like domain-containing protein [Candidatus Comchoanobacterales bacterium]